MQRKVQNDVLSKDKNTGGRVRLVPWEMMRSRVTGKLEGCSAQFWEGLKY